MRWIGIDQALDIFAKENQGKTVKSKDIQKWIDKEYGLLLSLRTIGNCLKYHKSFTSLRNRAREFRISSTIDEIKDWDKRLKNIK